MKKLYSMLLSAVVVASSNIVSAQQLPNVGFENWKETCGSTEAFGASTGMRQRPGIEPADWNGSNVNQKVMGVTKKEDKLITRETTIFAAGNSSAVM